MELNAWTGDIEVCRLVWLESAFQRGNGMLSLFRIAIVDLPQSILSMLHLHVQSDCDNLKA